MGFTAKYKSRCGTCNDWIQKGVPVSWQQSATRKQLVVHDRCMIDLQYLVDKLNYPIQTPTIEQETILATLYDTCDHLLINAGIEHI